MSTRTIIALLILIGAFVAVRYDKNKVLAPTPVACTQEAKQCPDGSYVSRSGPQCEFAECPKAVPVPSTTSTGTVSGVVSLSPACGGPVRMPPDPNCLFKGYQTTITFSGSNNIYSANSNTYGEYSINIPVGTYKIKAQGGQTLPSCPTSETIVVQANKTVVKDIDCDSGLR